jgi:hypothetical protein
MLAVAAITLALHTSAASAGPTIFFCGGAKADAARKIAHADQLKIGMDAKACFGEMKLTPSNCGQIVVIAPVQDRQTARRV